MTEPAATEAGPRTSPEPRAGGATRSVLRRRDARLLLGSMMVSGFGDFLYVVALSAYLYERTGSAAWVSAAVLGRFVPYTVLSPLAGVVADRYERRLVMAAGETVQLLAMAALTVTAVLDGPPLLLIACATSAACAATLYQSSASAMVASVVPEDELAAANSLRSTISEISFIAGPGAGALLLLFGDPVFAFAINTATFAVSALLVLAIRTRSAPRRTEGGSAARELRDGVRAFRADRTAVVLVSCLVAGTVVYGVEMVVLVLVSDELLGTGTGGLGFLLAASGVGGVIGAVISARLAGLARARAVLAVLVLLTGIPLACLSVVRAPGLAYAVLVVEGIAIVALDVLVETALQRSLPREVLGRVSGVVISLSSVGTAVGTLVAPFAVRTVGLETTLVVAGLLPVTLAAVGLLRLSSLDATVGRTRDALAGRVAVLGSLRLFEGIGPAGLERVAGAATEVRVTGGDVVLRQGDPADDLYVLVEGRLGVDHRTTGGSVRINEMTAPDYLGEIGIVHEVPRTASVVALGEGLLWRVPGEVFREVTTGGAGLSPALVGGISTRLARTPGALR